MNVLSFLRMKWLKLLFVVPAFLVFSCSNTKAPSNATAVDSTIGKRISLEELETMSFVTGHTVYVPAYSHIYHQEESEFDLTATLSIRNTDFNNPIIVKAAKYYNTAGKVVREYLDSPLELPSMATLDLVVGERDRTGGSGANFIVEWVAEKQVSDPIIECVMIGTSGQQGVSFLSVGKVIQ